MAQGGKHYGQFAPADAYVNGSPLAYYGSENDWNRRMFTAERADEFYKRRGQRELLAILDGQPKQAVHECQQYIKREPADLESRFLLTVAWCQLGDVEKAYKTMVEAVRAGLPLERFLAGPRELLRPLTRSQTFIKYAASRVKPLIHGPMLGSVTDHGARFWVRTVAALPVTVRVFKPGESSVPVATGKAQVQKKTDYTAIVEVTGLQPATRYTYEVLVDGRLAAAGPDLEFHTFPAQGKPGRFRVAFGGGAGYTPPHERMWNTIDSYHPDTLLLLGDNVYIDLPEQPRGFHRYTYYRRQSRPEFRKLISHTATYAIWDDHDCAIDDIWMGPYLDRPSWKPAMLTIFRENWNNPAYGNQQVPGCWFHLPIADVDFFLLDCRYYRTNPFGKQPTMLGPRQKAWLLDGLKQSQAQFKVIVSSVPWAPGAKPGSRDTWDGFRQEREEIFKLLESRNIEGVVLLSADRHRSDAWKIERPAGYPLYDLMSSRLTNIHTHECFDQALFCYNKKCSFGLLTFDTTRPDPELVYQIVNIDGQVMDSLKLRKSQLVKSR